jgi:hypothetical protein
MIGDGLQINYMTITLHFKGIIGDSLEINYMTTILDIFGFNHGGEACYVSFRTLQRLAM